MEPLVSVYMTVKNGSRWVGFAIESIQAQTLKEWELIVVDDGSSDNTVEILTDLSKDDPRIKVIPTEGIGRGAALNLALTNCQAEFVANLDADDLAHPKRLEIQYTCARKHCGFSLFSSASVIVKGDSFPEWPSFDQVPGIQDVTQKLAYYNPINHSAVFARRETITKVGGYNQSLRGQLDYDMWVRLAEAGYRLGRINIPLAAKRWHDAQSFEAKGHLRYLANSLRIQARAIKSLSPGRAAWLYLLARFVWGMVPRQLRLRLKRG